VLDFVRAKGGDEMPTVAVAKRLLFGHLLCLSSAGLAPLVVVGSRSSSIALTADGRLLLIVNPDSDSLSIVETPSFSLVAEVLVGDNPQSVAVSPEGALAYVTNRDDDTLAVVDLAKARVIVSIPVGDEPSGVVAGRDGRIYVASAGASALEVVEAATRAIAARVSTEPSPRGLALSADGTRLYATHFTTGRLSVIDTRALRVERVISTVPDSNLSNGIVLDESSQLAYLPQTRSNVSNRALLFDSTVFPIVSVVDLVAGRALPDRRIALDIADRPVSLPLDAVLTPGGKLYVINAGSDGLSVLDARTGSGRAHLQVGRHPTGAALSGDGRTLFVNNTLSGTVSVIDTSTDTVVREVAVTEIPLARDVLNGKILFSTSARSVMAKDRWISCASCHFNAEADGRTWFFADGPRNTPSLLGVRDTLPIHWSGDFSFFDPNNIEVVIKVLNACASLPPA